VPATTTYNTGDGPGLSYTGVRTVPAIVWAALMLLAGTGFLMLARRRS
jgi:LPXTG-motif cell wall-anchored protein